MYINSPGGVVTSGLAIYDTMQVQKHKQFCSSCCCFKYIQCPVKTLCIGQAASMASLILAAGSEGERKALPNSRIMLHQPSGGATVSNN